MYCIETSEMNDHTPAVRASAVKAKEYVQAQSAGRTLW